MRHRWNWGAVALVLGAICGGCDRTHMSSHFGEANREAFRAQVIDLDAGNGTKPNPPLDPEEAASIARGLSKSLTPPAAAGAGYRDPILVVPQATAGAAPAPDPGR